MTDSSNGKRVTREPVTKQLSSRTRERMQESASPSAATVTGDAETVTVTVDQTDNGRLGFSVRGGVEHGLNIFISKVEPHSPAEQAGLCVGDKLLEVNGVGLENISISSAVQVLRGHRQLRLVLQRVGWVPGVRFTNGKTTWVDLIHQRLVVEEGRVFLSDSRSDSVVSRSVRLQTSLSHPCLGLNIRGGTEYGLGIYVSKVDPGGLAEQGGVKMGDQILSANGVSFDDVTHSRAVEVLKSQPNVTLIIKAAHRRAEHCPVLYMGHKILLASLRVKPDHPPPENRSMGQVSDSSSVEKGRVSNRSKLSKETGRYPAYQDIVAKYSSADKRGSGMFDCLSRGSVSSWDSSASSGTPLSSVAGLSQATLPVCLPFGPQQADGCSVTEDQQVTDAATSAGHTHQPNTSLTCDLTHQPNSSPTSDLTHQPNVSPTYDLAHQLTEALHDLAIHDEEAQGQRGQEQSGEEHGEQRRTSAPTDPKRPRALISRSQSHMTVSEKEQMMEMQMERRERYRIPPRRSKTLVGLSWMSDSNRSPSRSSTRSPTESPTRSSSRSSTKSPNRTSAESPTRSQGRSETGTGDVELQDANVMHQQNHLLEKSEQLCATQQPREILEPSRAFSPLLDIPVGTSSYADSLRPAKSTHTSPNWLLTEKTQTTMLPETVSGMACSKEDLSHLEKNECPESKADRKKAKKKNMFFTVEDTPHHRRPPLSQVFGPLKRSNSTGVPPTGRRRHNQVEEHVQSVSVSSNHSDQTD